MPQEVIEVVEREVEVIEILERGLMGMTGPAGPQANINYLVVSSSQAVSNRQMIAADTSGGSFTLTLPSNPAAGDAIDIFDYSDTFDTNPLTIARNGQNIEGLADDLVANVEGAYFTLIFTGGSRGWQVVPRYGVSGLQNVLTTEGDLIYRGGSAETRLGIGTSGQVLTVNSGATAPEWAALPDSIDDYTVVTTSQTIANGARLAADTSGGSFTLTLPATPNNGDTFYILDFAKTFDTNNLTLARNGSLIEGVADDMVCNVEGSSFKMVYTGSTNGGWQMIPFFGVAGVASVSGTAPIVSSGGATPAISITPATTSAAGSMSAADKVKLNGAAPLESPAFTGTPTAPTASAGTNTTQLATTAFTLANRGDRYLTTSTSSHSITTGSKTFTVQSGLSYTATQDITIVYDGNPTGQHMHGVVTSYSGTTLVVNVESVEGSGGPFTAWTINVGGLLTAQGALLEANNLSDVANPATALTNIGGVPTSRTISSGTGLTGGGDLTANRTLAVSYGTTAGTAAEGNDARLSDARTPLSHTHGNITNDGKITGAGSGLPVVTTTDGAVTTLALGTANQVLRVNSGATGVEFGAGFDAASPPAIGNTTPNSGAFTTLAANNGTLTASAPVLDLSQTWNNSGVTFTGLRVNATDTASAAASLLADFQVGGTSFLSVRKDGVVRFRTGNLNIAAFQIGNVTVGTAGGGGELNVNTNFSASSLLINGGVLSLRLANGQSPVMLARDDGNIFAQRNGTAAQEFRIYNTFTSATNFERLNLRWASNVAIIGTAKGSAGGTARALEFQVDGQTRLTLPTGSGLQINSGGGTAYNWNCNNQVKIEQNEGLGLASGMAINFYNSTFWHTGSPDTQMRRVSAGLVEINNATAGTYRDLVLRTLMVGGTTASFPSLRHSSTTLQVRLADNSGFAPLECAGLTLNGDLTASTRNIVTDTTTGTKIGTDPLQKIGFFDKTPVVQQAAIADATDAATTQARLNDLLATMRTFGLIAT